MDINIVSNIVIMQPSKQTNTQNTQFFKNVH